MDSPYPLDAALSSQDVLDSANERDIEDTGGVPRVVNEYGLDSTALSGNVFASLGPPLLRSSDTLRVFI